MKYVAEKLGYKNSAYISQLIGKNPIEQLSERTAREMENKLGLPPGSLDSPIGEQANDRSSTSLTEALTSLVEGLSPDTLNSLPSEIFGQLCALIFTQHRQGNQLSDEFVNQIIKLASRR